MFMKEARTLRAKHQAEVRELILAAAREAFVLEGHAQFTMRELAQRLGCSPGAIYLHFSGKDELLRCLVEESFAKLLEVLEKAPTGADPTANLKAKLRAYVEFGLDYPHHYYVAFLLPQAATSRGNLPTLTPHEAFAVLRRSVAECRSRGRMPAVDEEAASQALWAAVHGITSLLIAKPRFPWLERERLIRTVITMAVDGLGGAAPAPVGRAPSARRRTGQPARNGVRHD